jgi:hypothetical protein
MDLPMPRSPETAIDGIRVVRVTGIEQRRGFVGEMGWFIDHAISPSVPALKECASRRRERAISFVIHRRFLFGSEGTGELARNGCAQKHDLVRDRRRRTPQQSATYGKNPEPGSF